MKLVLHSVLLWCVLSTLVARFAAARPDPSLESGKRLSVWLRMLVRPPAGRGDAETFARARESRATDTFPPHHRLKSTARSPGCNLITCIVHELPYRVNQVNGEKVPKGKMGNDGYGRRRRRAPAPVRQGAGAASRWT
uniref:Uncharacterized protein n=1 Tax=Denticeps clupeoides TaxID=299321 RepID=A0AAY4D455_9TELE